MNSQPKSQYRAFISYSHVDKKWAQWLRRKIECYRVPRDLAGTVIGGERLPRRLTPVFVDKDELPATADLSAAVRDALADSRHLIVLCSRDSSKSQWVNEEVRQFKELHGSERLITAVVDKPPDDLDQLRLWPNQALCPNLKSQQDDSGKLTNVGDSLHAYLYEDKRHALIMILSGLLGVGFDTLQRRERQRKKVRAVLISMGILISVLSAGLGIRYNVIQKADLTRQEAVSAIANSDKATARKMFEHAVALRKKVFAPSSPAESFFLMLQDANHQVRPNVLEVLPVPYGCQARFETCRESSQYRRVLPMAIHGYTDTVVDVVSNGELLAFKSDTAIAIRKFDPKTGISKEVLSIAGPPVSVRISPRGDSVLILDSDDEVEGSWSLRLSSLNKPLSSRPVPVPVVAGARPNAIAYTNDGKYIVVASGRGGENEIKTHICLIDTDTLNSKSCSISDFDQEIVFIANHPLSNQLAIFTEYGNGCVWLLDNGRCNLNIEHTSGDPKEMSVDFIDTGFGRQLLTVKSGSVRFWSYEVGPKFVEVASSSSTTDGYVVSWTGALATSDSDFYFTPNAPYIAVHTDTGSAILGLRRDSESGLFVDSATLMSGPKYEHLPSHLDAWVGESIIEVFENEFAYASAMCMSEDRNILAVTFEPNGFGGGAGGVFTWKKGDKGWVINSDQLERDFDLNTWKAPSLNTWCGAEGWYPDINMDPNCSGYCTVRSVTDDTWIVGRFDSLEVGLENNDVSIGWWPFFADPDDGKNNCTAACTWTELPFLTLAAIDPASGLVFAGGNLATFQVWSIGNRE